MVGQAEAFFRIVSEGPLDLIVAAHAKRCVDIAVASVKGVVARAVDSVTLACEVRVRRILNRPCTELRPEGAAKVFSREQPLILDTSVRCVVRATRERGGAQQYEGLLYFPAPRWSC